jgi:hypothetical protein
VTLASLSISTCGGVSIEKWELLPGKNIVKQKQIIRLSPFLIA